MTLIKRSGTHIASFLVTTLGVAGAALAVAPGAELPQPPRDRLLTKEADPAKAEDRKRDGIAEPALPGGAWDTRALKLHFGLLKVDVNGTKGTVTWLVERKDDGYVSFNASFYDSDDVKLGQSWIEFAPDLAQVKKGERTRGTVTLLKDDVMKKVVKVVITKR